MDKNGGLKMEIFDNRKADDLKSWGEINQGEVFEDTTETEYPTYYMKTSGNFFVEESYVDLTDGTVYKYISLERIPQFRILNAEMRINY